MIFDTDVFISVQRGNRRAAALIDGTAEGFLSVQTLMELLQCAKSKEQQRITKKFLADFGFTILPLKQNIGHRALVCVEEYGISSGMRAGEAIVAATAAEYGMTLATSNRKHFRSVKDLNLHILKP